MNSGEIYAKTEAGARELRERRQHLSVALRSLLIMIDGKRTVGDVLASTRALHLGEDDVALLERGGLIVRRSGGPPSVDGSPYHEPSDTEVDRYLSAQQIMSDAINRHLGFRGYGLMMRLQRTSTLRDLHELLPEFAQALVKRTDVDTATPVVLALERLIQLS